MTLPFELPEPIAEYDIEVFRKDPAEAREHALEIARRLFLRQGELPMVTFFYGRKIPPWIMSREPPPTTDLLWCCPMREVNNQAKELFARALPFLAQSVAAIAAAMVFEGWVYPHGEDEKEKVLAYKRKHGSIEGYPGVQECVHVTYETTTTAELWQAAILRAGTLRLGCFVKLPQGINEGRFRSLLLPFDAPVHA